MGKKSLYDRTDKKLQRIASTVGAIVAIIGAVTGVCSWVSNQFTQAISAQISDFRSEMRSSNEKQDQQITRLELMNLIQNDPTNITGIEKLAKYYFQDLNGNQYMTGVYSKWCQEYGGDPSVVIGGS